ncbi:MAG: sigma-70 family RNA polymerase sigma factor [Gemmatimonas sp.]|nr:sigma-70 family RNA polymerase sigma factor [Gemmatimonas sp.]
MGIACQAEARLSIAPSGRVDNDDVLMGRILEGCPFAFGELFERYWDPLVDYASGFVGALDEAEDVVQETFVRVWKTRSAWSPSGTISAYLYRITRNLSLNARRDVRTRREREACAGVVIGLACSPPWTPLQEFEGKQLEERMNAAVAQLPLRRREVLLLSFVNHFSRQEIATEHGVTTRTVSNQMSAALSQLRRVAADHLEQC